MTKARETAVLKQIADLIASTGAESYISFAFKGCVRDAERNIEDDAAYSAYDRAEIAEERYARETEARAKAMAEAREARAEAEAHKAAVIAANERTNQKEHERYALQTAYAEIRDDLDSAMEDLAAAQQQIMELKARLYDYMTA